MRVGLAELPPAQVVFATDYPQAVRDDDEVVAYVKAVSALGSEAQAVLNGASAEKLIPNLRERLNRGHIDAGRSERGVQPFLRLVSPLWGLELLDWIGQSGRIYAGPCGLPFGDPHYDRALHQRSRTAR